MSESAPYEDILHRTYKIQVPTSNGYIIGTGFMIFYKAKYWFLTSRYIIRDQEHAKSIDDPRFTWIGSGKGHADVSVFAVSEMITREGQTDPNPEMVTTMKRESIPLGEDVMFLGYPTGIKTVDNENKDMEFLIPLIHKGITSAWFSGKPYFMIQSSSFPGASGGPVVIHNKTKKEGESDLNVIGILSGKTFTEEKIPTGFLKVTWITEALEIIDEIATKELIAQKSV